MLNSAETSEAPDSVETPQNSVFIIKDIRPMPTHTAFAKR